MKFLRTIVSLLACSIAVHAAPDQKINQKKIDFLKQDLESLRANTQDNGAIDELLSRANRIAQMNDKCGAISLTEVLDDDCQNFFAVELPQFEQDVAKTTGEIRMGALQLDNSLKNRIQKITSCAEALQAFFLPYPELIDVNVDVIDVIPLDASGSSFKVSYDFNMNYRKSTMKQLKEMGKLWQKQCNEAVIDKSTGEYIELFTNEVKKVNDKLKSAGVSSFALAERKSRGSLVTSRITIYMKKKKSYGAYLMNGRKLFDVSPDDKRIVIQQMFSTESYDNGRSYRFSNQVVNNDENCGICDAGTGQHKFGAQYRGSESFHSQDSDNVNGRWIWY